MTATQDRTSGARTPRPRRSRAELRALLIQSGLEVLREDGLGSGAEHLTFKRVFERVAVSTGTRVTNASVIGRLWENQAAFQSEVLAHVAADEVVDQEHAVMAAVSGVAESADLSTIASRRSVLRELFRVTAEANLQVGTASRSWATVIGVWALASGARGTANTDRIHEAIGRSHAATDRRSIAATEALMEFLGLRVRHPLTADQFSRSCSALVEGCALRDRAGQRIRGIELPTGPDGEVQEWTILGIGMDALAEQFFEPDPDWTPDGVDRSVAPPGGWASAGTGIDPSGTVDG